MKVFIQWRVKIFGGRGNFSRWDVNEKIFGWSGLLFKSPQQEKPCILEFDFCSNNHGNNILELYNVLVQIIFTTSKTKRDIQYSKLGIRVASRVAEDLESQDTRKFQEKLILDWKHNLVPSLPSINSTQKQISNFSCPVQFHWISLFCSKYFVQDCLSKQNFGLNSTQVPSKLNFLTFFVSSKLFFNL